MNTDHVPASRRLPRRPRNIAVIATARGFTLLELAVVLVIITMLLAALFVPLNTQIVQRRYTDTQKTLDDVREALIGFALATTRLPCPASSTSGGAEAYCTNATGACGAQIVAPPAAIPSHGRCVVPWGGFVPGIALGIPNVDAQGYVIDAWSRRMHYSVTTSNSNAFTTSSGMRIATLTALAPDLQVCASGTGVTATTCGTAPVLTNSAPAVIFSLGPNATTGGGVSTDEAANLNGTQVFVSRIRTDRGATVGEFDDLVTWLSENMLYSRMVAAGQLP